MTDRPESPKQRVTMKDVAGAAGVSQSTVSFVMNGSTDMRISDDTRSRVLAAADRLGYRTRTVGRPPAGTSRRVIGMIIDEIATSAFAAISIDGAREEAWKSGTLVQVAMSGGDPNYETEILRKWHSDGIDGVIYATILTREVTPPDTLVRHKAVLLNCHDPADRYPSVVPAERRGGEAATRALLDAGHQRIAFISGEPWMDASIQRREGFERAIRASGRSMNPDLVVEGNFLPSGGYEATLSLMDRETPPDAIFCANDLMAVGSYEALKERGNRIGEDISVMGYDDQEIAQHLSPQLSTVLLPHREMGHWCIKALSGAETPESVRIECPVVLRQSHLRST